MSDKVENQMSAEEFWGKWIRTAEGSHAYQTAPMKKLRYKFAEAYASALALSRAPEGTARTSTIAALEAEWLSQDKILDYRNWLQDKLLQSRAAHAHSEGAPEPEHEVTAQEIAEYCQPGARPWSHEMIDAQAIAWVLRSEAEAALNWQAGWRHTSPGGGGAYKCFESPLATPATMPAPEPAPADKVREEREALRQKAREYLAAQRLPTIFAESDGKGVRLDWLLADFAIRQPDSRNQTIKRVREVVEAEKARKSIETTSQCAQRRCDLDNLLAELDRELGAGSNDE